MYANCVFLPAASILRPVCYVLAYAWCSFSLAPPPLSAVVRVPAIFAQKQTNGAGFVYPTNRLTVPALRDVAFAIGLIFFSKDDVSIVDVYRDADGAGGFVYPSLHSFQEFSDDNNCYFVEHIYLQLSAFRGNQDQRNLVVCSIDIEPHEHLISGVGDSFTETIAPGVPGGVEFPEYGIA